MKKYPNYKDSGIEWIGEIPEDWQLTKLKFLGHAFGGLTYSPNDIVENFSQGKLVLRSSNIQNGKLDLNNNVYVNSKISEKLTLKRGDILICSRNGSQHLIGKNICIDERMEGNTFGAFMMIFRSENWRFLNQFFNSPIFMSQSGLFLTATINQLTSSTINNFWIAIPRDIDDQTAIANYLDHKTAEIDTFVSNKEKLIELLKEERTAIINHAVTKGINPNVKLKDSGVEWIGEIPEHWEVKRVDWVSNIVRGNSAFKKDELLDSGEYVALQYGKTYKVDIVDDDFKFFVNSEFYKESQVVSKGDTILISTSETIEDLGHSCYYDNENIGLIGGEQILLKPNREVLNEKYLYYYSRKLGSLLRKYAKGLKVYRYNTSDLKQIFFAIPPKQEQEIIAKYLDKKTVEVDDLVSKTEKEIELLNEYKTALISEVVTGKVDVRDEVLA